MKRTLLFALILPWFALAARALEFRVVSWDGEIAGLRYAEGAKTREIVAEEGVYSLAHTVSGAGPLLLFREVTEAGETRRVPAAELTPPAGLTHALLILSPVDAARTRFNGLWIDDSAEARPAQTITLRNLSSMPVAVRIDAGDHTLASGASVTLPTNPAARRVPFKLAAQTTDGWKVVASGSQAVRPGRRTLILLRDGREQSAGQRDLVDMVALSDRPAPALAALKGR